MPSKDKEKKKKEAKKACEKRKRKKAKLQGLEQQVNQSTSEIHGLELEICGLRAENGRLQRAIRVVQTERNDARTEWAKCRDILAKVDSDQVFSLAVDEPKNSVNILSGHFTP